MATTSAADPTPVTKNRDPDLSYVAASQLELVHRLAQAVESRDSETGEHIHRIGVLCRRLALEIGLSLEEASTGGASDGNFTSALGVPCFTLRNSTERPITVDEGTNTMVGDDRVAILQCVDEILAGRGKRGRTPEYWDGHAAERIAADLQRWLAEAR